MANRVATLIKLKLNRITSRNSTANNDSILKQAEALLNRVMLRKRHVYRYLSLLQVKLRQGNDLSTSIKTIYKKRKEIIPSSDKTVLNFYRAMDESWERSTNPRLERILDGYLSETELMVLASANDTATGIEIILELQKTNSSNKKALFVAALSPIFYLSLVIGIVNLTHEEGVEKTMSMIERSGGIIGAELNALNWFHTLVLSYQWIIIPAIALVVTLYYFALPTLKGSSRDLTERVFLFGLPFKLHRLYSSIVFLQTFACLSKAGEATSEILRKLEEMATPYLAYEISSIKKSFAITGMISKSLNTSLFDKNTMFELAVYLETNKPSESISDVAKQVNEAIKTRIVAIAWLTNISGLLAAAAYVLMLTLGNFSVINSLKG